MAESELTYKQRRFVDEYLVSLNASKAAINAGYSKNTAPQQGSRLLKNAKVSAEIEQRMEKNAMSANEVLHRLTEQARGDIGDFVLSRASDLVEHPQSSLVKKIKVRTKHYNKDDVDEEYFELELHDSQSALVHLGKAYGIFRDVHQHTGKDGDNVKLELVYPE